VAPQREATDAFQAEYDRHNGIEGIISRGVRSTHLRRTRHRGLARVFLGHILTAVGLNVLRLGEWLLETAHAKSRLTPLAEDYFLPESPTYFGGYWDLMIADYSMYSLWMSLVTNLLACHTLI
jgi:Transposase DDE domain